MSCFSMDMHMHFDLYKDKWEILEYIECNHSYTIAVSNLPILFGKYFCNQPKYKYIRFALGFHPELAFEYKNQISLFLKYIDYTRYIGEIGLDFSTMDFENRRRQIEIFSKIVIECSKRKNKILSIHSRKAQKEVLDILEDFDGKVILHWYTGSIKDLERAIHRGYYFSINHQMIETISGRKIIDKIPLNKILLESDAPFTKQTREEYRLFFIESIYDYLVKSRGVSKYEISTAMKSNLKKILS